MAFPGHRARNIHYPGASRKGLWELAAKEGKDLYPKNWICKSKYSTTFFKAAYIRKYPIKAGK